MRRRLWTALTVLGVMAALFALGGWAGHRATVLRLEDRGQAALGQVSDRLVGQIDRYRYLPSVLAQHPVVVAAAMAPSDGSEGSIYGRANALMERVADSAGAQDIYLMDAQGITVASSNWLLSRSFIGSDFSWRPYFQRAIRGGLGYYHAVGTTSGERGFYFAHPVRDAEQRIIGVLTVKLDLERLESAWRGDANVVFFSDARGVVFLANRYELILRALSPAGARPPQSLADERQYAGKRIVPLSRDPRSSLHGLPAWSIDDVPFVPASALWISAPLPSLGLTGNVLVDTTEARVQAVLWGGLASALGGVVMLLWLISVQRRNAYRRQLATEERAKVRLEAQVRARTAELIETNAALRGEIDERVAAEAALREVQEQLVQAAKLKGLGEMSAGISHELNQPLTAIQTLADNAEILMERGRTAEVTSNLSRISQLASRAGRIIRNLRAFARNEAVTVEAVDLVPVVADAVDITAARLREAGVALDWTPPPGPVLVRGGRVRLQQVLVNLIGNAADAMTATTGEKRISLSLAPQGDAVALQVRDTGPGLREPERIFDPFYTTKEVGEGLGLGLSISYGIVQSFGGGITGENCPEGGAVFTVLLAAARREEAAA